jgi:ornithine cyclodeaminase
MLAVRQFTEIKVWSRTLKHAQTFARRAAERYNQPVGATQTAGEAVEGADVICTVTSATDPVLHGVWLEAGMHINAVGSSVPVTRELDTEAVVKSRLFVDRRESAVNEAGDFLFPLKEKALTEAHIQGEIGDILLDNIRGRESQTDITLFKSLGLAVEDVAAALHIYQKMTAQNQGTRIEFNGTKG